MVAGRGALVIVGCLMAAACSATAPAPRPLASGFSSGSGVADPYADGKRHLAAGRYQVAVERFGQALANDRRSLDALNGLAIAYTRLGRFDIARTYFERALQVDPTSVATLNNYGWSLTEQGRLREARPFLELALSHAQQADVPVVAGNIESIRRARPPALVAALDGTAGPPAHSRPHRLVRVDNNAYRLDTVAPDEPPEPMAAADDARSPERWLLPPGSTGVSSGERPPPSEVTSAPPVVAESVGPTDDVAPSANRSQAAEPHRDHPMIRPSGDGPIQLWPDPADESKAATIRAGEQP